MLATAILTGLGLVAAPVLLTGGQAVAAGPAATVTSVSPVSGVQTGGNTITITGTNLGSTGVTTVSVGSIAATSVVVNANGKSLTAVVPSNPNSPSGGPKSDQPMTSRSTTGGGGASATSPNDRYTYEYDAHTCGVSPFSSSCAATITAQETAPTTGTLVSATAGGADILQVPLGATVTLDVNDAGTLSGANYSLSTLDVSDFSTPVIIENSIQASTSDSTTVMSNTARQARFMAEADHCGTQPAFPADPQAGCALNGPGTGVGGDSDPIIVQWGAPTVTLVSPSAGPLGGGTSVTVTGTNLTGASAVNFGGSAGTGVVVNSATSVTATSPAEAAGTVDITVVTPIGLTATSAGDQYTYSTGPSVSSVSPTSGPSSGGTSVTVNGANFTGTTAVKFGSVAGTNIVVNGGGTSLTVTSPAGSPGTVDITVTATGGTSATSAADHFTYDVGYWEVASDGGIFSYGAPFYGSTGGVHLNKPIVGMAPTPGSGGYWLVASDGGIFSYGNANFYGSTGGITLNKPVVGMAATPSGHGYWLVASDGGIFSYGDATFYGSTGGIHLNKPIVGMAATPSGHGYWLVASDGGIFSYGDATFYGSTGAIHLNKPVVGMTPTASGHGYWLVASDGGIFSYGDATFQGSTGGITINKPVVGMAVDPQTNGYWLVASDGGIFAYNSPFLGSTGGTPLNKPVVGMAVSTG